MHEEVPSMHQMKLSPEIVTHEEVPSMHHIKVEE